MSEEKLAEFRRLAEGAVALADFDDLQRRSTVRRRKQWMTGLGVAAAAAVLALAVIQPWAGGTRAAPDPADHPSETPTAPAEPTTVPINAYRHYRPGEVIADQIELCRTAEAVCPDEDVVTATVTLTVSGHGWRAATEGDVVNLNTETKGGTNRASVAWTPFYGWSTTQLCKEGPIDREDVLPVGAEGSAAIPAVAFGETTDVRFGGRVARQVVVEVEPHCQDDVWFLVTSDQGELRHRARVAAAPHPLTVTMVPLPEVGDHAFLAFYDFAGDFHRRTPQQLEEREAIKESLTIAVE